MYTHVRRHTQIYIFTHTYIYIYISLCICIRRYKTIDTIFNVNIYVEREKEEGG
jgi:hypothetical protein